MAKVPSAKSKSSAAGDAGRVSDKATGKTRATVTRKAAAKKSPKKSLKTPTDNASDARARNVEVIDSPRVAGLSLADEIPEGDLPILTPEATAEMGFAPESVEDINPDEDVVYVPPTPRKAPTRARGSLKSTRAVTPEIVDDENESSSALTTMDPVATYLAEIRRYPLLTREQERELAERYRETGDPRAAELLVTSNLRFVVKVAAEYSRFGAKLIDLVQEGNVGLMHAVKEFNPYKGVRLITYAVWWIRGYIQEYLMRQYSMVRIGTTQNQRKLFYRLQKEKDSLDLAGREPNYALLAGRLGVTEEEVETMTKRLSGRDISLNQPVDGENSTASLLDFEPSLNEAVDETLGHLEEMQVLRQNLDQIRGSLNAKETYILENRVLSDEPMTLQEIGDHYGVTREAVRQLEARLIGKIRSAVTTSLIPHETPSEEEE